MSLLATGGLPLLADKSPHSGSSMLRNVFTFFSPCFTPESWLEAAHSAVQHPTESSSFSPSPEPYPALKSLMFKSSRGFPHPKPPRAPAVEKGVRKSSACPLDISHKVCSRAMPCRSQRTSRLGIGWKQILQKSITPSKNSQSY